MAAAWTAAQELRLLYRHHDPAHVTAAFYRWLALLPARVTIADVSDGPTEAINPVIKKIKRVGYGFRNTHLLSAAAAAAPALLEPCATLPPPAAARPPPRFMTKSRISDQSTHRRRP